MFTNPHQKIKFFKLAADLRFGIYRLQSYIGSHSDPSQLKSGTMYVFTNSSRTLLKMLWFDGSGFCLYSKRLESGTFCRPKSATDDSSLWLHLSPSAFQLLLDGIDLKEGAKRAWYEVEYQG